MKQLVTTTLALAMVITLGLNRETFAQNVGINDNGAAPNSNAILDIDVSSNDKGILIPRLTTSERTGIAGLAAADEGLMVYDETTNSFWFWDGTQWMEVQNTGSGIYGGDGTAPSDVDVTVTDNIDFDAGTLFIDGSNNRIGIGTTSPTEAVELFQNTNGSLRLEINNPNTGASAHGQLFFSSDVGDGRGYIALFGSGATDPDYTDRFMITGRNGTDLLIGAHDPGNIVFATGFEAVGSQEKMRISNAGDVGIGTTTPAEKLDINGNLTLSGGDRLIKNNTADGSDNHYLALCGGGDTGSSRGAAVLVQGNEDPSNPGDMILKAGNVAGGQIRFRTAADLQRAVIDESGNFGIGTTAPGELLDVSGNMAFSGGNRNINQGTSDGSDTRSFIIAAGGAPGPDRGAYIQLQGNEDPSNPGDIFFQTGNVGGGAFVFRTGASVDRAILNQAGDFGIGTPTPGGQLELSLDEGRKPATNTWTIVSDERLKNIDGEYTKGLDEILRLNPITYQYKNVGKRTFEEEVLNSKNVGFSAQEVQKVFPEAVGVDSDGYLNFNMHSILVAYVNSIKTLADQNATLVSNASDQQVQIESLQEQVQELKKEFHRISSTK